jgi:hypothetical protein
VADGSLKLTDEEIDKLAQATRVFDNYHLMRRAGNHPEPVEEQCAECRHAGGGGACWSRSATSTIPRPCSAARHFKIDFGLSMQAEFADQQQLCGWPAHSDTELDALEKQLEPLRQQSLDGVTHLKVSVEEAFKHPHAAAQGRAVR